MITALLAVLLMVAGVAGVALAAWKSHETQRQLDFIRTLGQEVEHDTYHAVMPDRVHTPLVDRLFGPTARRIRHSLSRLYPSRDIDRVHADLLKAGLTGSVRAEEFAALQVSSVLIGAAIGLSAIATGLVNIKVGLCLLFFLPLAGALGPAMWLRVAHLESSGPDHQRPARRVGSHDDLRRRRARPRAGHAGIVRALRLGPVR